MEAATTMDKLQEAESEAKSMRTMTKRMVLTQEEMVCFVPLCFTFNTCLKKGEQKLTSFLNHVGGSSS